MISQLLNPLFGVCPDGRGIYVFGLEIYYYAFCIVGGMIAAALFSALLMKRRNMSSDFIFTLFLICIPTAIIGARLFSVLTDGSGIQNFFNFRDGGLSITGGVIGGVLAGFVVCKVKKVEFLRAADCVVVNVLIAMVIGRWGNFFNQEVYGELVITNPALQRFPFAVFIDKENEWRLGLCFIEGGFNIVAWALLYTFAWYRKKKPNGMIMLLSAFWFGFLRMCLEPLRDGAFQLGNNVPEWLRSLLGSKVPISFWFAVYIWTLAIVGILTLLLVNHKKEGAFLGSVKGDPCGITQFAKAYKDEVPYFSKINMFGASYPPAPPKEVKKQKPKGDKKE